MNKKMGRKLALKKETLVHVTGALLTKLQSMYISCGGYYTQCNCPSMPGAGCQPPPGSPMPVGGSDACNNTSSSNTVVCPQTRC